MDKFYEFAFEVFTSLDSSGNKKYDLHPKSELIQNAANSVVKRHKVTPLKHKALNFVKAYFRQMGIMEEVVESGNVFYRFTQDGQDLHKGYVNNPLGTKKSFMESIRDAGLAMRGVKKKVNTDVVVANKVRINDRINDSTQNITITLPTGVVQVKNTEANRNYILQLLLNNIQ